MSSIVSPVSGMTQKVANVDLQKKEAEAAEAAKAAEEQKKLADLREADKIGFNNIKSAPRGRAATMLTGGAGLMNSASTAKKTLMGY